MEAAEAAGPGRWAGTATRVRCGDAESPRSRRHLLGSLTPRRCRGRAGGRASRAGAERRRRGAGAWDLPRRNW